MSIFDGLFESDPKLQPVCKNGFEMQAISLSLKDLSKVVNDLSERIDERIDEIEKQLQNNEDDLK